MATRADLGSLFGQWCFAHLARLDQPCCSCQSATTRPFRRCHLYAASAWIGGLPPLAIFLTRACASFSLGEWALPVVRRFSTLSLSCVGGLIVSGISNRWLLVGSIRALFTTRYGWLLLVKLALFGVLVGLGAQNRFVIKTKLTRVPAGSDLLAQLRRKVICEACLGLAVVAIVAYLGVTPPARGS